MRNVAHVCNFKAVGFISCVMAFSPTLEVRISWGTLDAELKRTHNQSIYIRAASRDSHFKPTVDCGAPPRPVNGSLQLCTSTTAGSEVVFWCDPGFVPERVMTAVCGSDGQWTPNPGNVTCSPRPTQILVPGENELLLSHNPTSRLYAVNLQLVLLFGKL